MPPVTWGKAYPLKPDQQDLLDAVDPRRPTIRSLGESTVIVSVPSHSPEYTPALNGLVDKFRERILGAQNLIIDIRGDEGGGSQMTRSLMPFLVTKSKRPSRYWAEGQPVILSSPDNIAYFTQMQSQGWIPAHLVERMRANPGKVIPFADPGSTSPAPQAATDDTATPRPRNVAILIDGAVVSAGEAFVLEAMKNEKVTLFGENTGGVIDYQNVAITRVPGCPSLGISLGYPTLSASVHLPTGGVNATGIAPDVRIGREIADPVQFIINYYARREKR
jgi:C-terminal processing protease CtpA/Prc